MKWLLFIEHCGYERVLVFEGSEDDARKKAIRFFDDFTFDHNFDYEKYIPNVMIYEINKSIAVDMSDYHLKHVEMMEKLSKANKELRERNEYERLRKKFGDEDGS